VARQSEEVKKYALLVAGGKGTRMKSEVPKQFLLLDGVPIIIRTLRLFWEAIPNIQIIQVLSADSFEEEKAFVLHHLKDTYPAKALYFAAGGKERTYSVTNGLKLLASMFNPLPDSLIAIHDSVRPLVSEQLIIQAFEAANIYRAIVPGVPVKFTLRKKISDIKSITIDRTDYVEVQTPQVFTFEIISNAYSQIDENIFFSDDASVVEAVGGSVKIIDGEYTNIKITTPEDLILASLLLQAKAKKDSQFRN
jgi:2-C-methyl-D-erythritol 4-phosphate cytidylyltransferase